MRTNKSVGNRKMRVESLETRQLMAANITATLSSGVLKVEGTNFNDTIIMRQIGNVISIDGVRINGSGAVNRIEMNGLGGNDVLRVDGNNVANQAVRIPATIWGGDGNDYIVGGSGNDQLIGGNGNDTIFGMLGNDSMWGEAGNDLLYGGDGNDDLCGGTGNDELLGETGNDNLWGQDGDDWLWGGDGNDYVDGGAGMDVGFGGRGSDRFVGLDDASFFLVNPHLKSPIRGVGNQSGFGIQDFSSSEGDRK